MILFKYLILVQSLWFSFKAFLYYLSVRGVTEEARILKISLTDWSKLISGSRQVFRVENNFFWNKTNILKTKTEANLVSYKTKSISPANSKNNTNLSRGKVKSNYENLLVEFLSIHGLAKCIGPKATVWIMTFFTIFWWTAWIWLHKMLTSICIYCFMWWNLCPTLYVMVTNSQCSATFFPRFGQNWL